jgi:hypothetical protein
VDNGNEDNEVAAGGYDPRRSVLGLAGLGLVVAAIVGLIVAIALHH